MKILALNTMEEKKKKIRERLIKKYSDKDRVPTAVAQKILTKFARDILTKEPEIQFVTLGSGGGTPKDMSFESALLSESTRNGHDYGDANRQYLIDAKPALVSNVTDENWDTALLNPSVFFPEGMDYLSRYFPREDLLQALNDDPTFTEALNNESVQRLLLLAKPLQSSDLLPIDLAQLPKSHAYSLTRMVWRNITPEHLTSILPYIMPKEQRLMVIQLHKDLSFRT